MQNTVILRGRDLFGTTVIDNRFISELVPDAPENAVRVYLYGLMLAGSAVSSPFRFLMHSSSAMHRLPKPSATGKNAVLCELSTAVCFP